MALSTDESERLDPRSGLLEDCLQRQREERMRAVGSGVVSRGKVAGRSRAVATGGVLSIKRVVNDNRWM
ncbi:hypothetical protein E4U21_002818 [Claviceps maximensis]|nr:hypothetical protein E4U21_002818 [Claviceps maximensis]